MIGDCNWWGKGLGKKVTKAIVGWGFSQLNLHKITLGVLGNNERAIRMYENLGFGREGVLRDEQFRDGKYLDLIQMAVFEAEWAAQEKGKDRRG